MITIADQTARRWIRDSVIAVAFFAFGMVFCRQCSVPGKLALPETSVVSSAASSVRGVDRTRTVERIPVTVPPLQPLSVSVPLRRLSHVAHKTSRASMPDPVVVEMLQYQIDSLRKELMAAGTHEAYRGDTIVVSTRDTVSVLCDWTATRASIDIRYAPRQATVERIHDSTTVTIVRRPPFTIAIGAGAIMNPLSTTRAILPGIFLGVAFNIVEIVP